MKIALGCDHAGFQLKEKIKTHLEKKGYLVIDHGTTSTLSVDYPNFAKKVANSITLKESDFGVLVCGTGIGMSITANRFMGIRAALCTNEFLAQMSRKHNDTNILCLGARVTEENDALKIVDTFLKAQFEGGRHSNRVNLIDTPQNS